jgi:hypothetical protein
MKTALIIGGALIAGIGIADLLLGNTNNPILPAALTNNLTQQSDVAAIVVGGGALWFGLAQL